MIDVDCFWHGEEPLPNDYYQLCGECGHVWPTFEDLEADVIASRIDAGLDPTYHTEVDLLFCPLCAHDF